MQFTTLLTLAFSATALAAPQLGGLGGLTSGLGGLSGGAAPEAAETPNTDNVGHYGYPGAIPEGMRTGAASAQCGNGQVLSCCGQKTGGSQGSLLGGAVQNLIGGNCDQVPINIIGANGILLQQCSSNQAACCTGDQNSLADVPCIPLSA